MNPRVAEADEGVRLVRILNRRLSLEERVRLLEWGRSLLRVRTSPLPAHAKAWKAIRLTQGHGAVLASLRGAGRFLVTLAWRDRGWSARFGVGAAAVTAAVAGGQGAGIAALGTAVGVPLWVVLGAGGSFVGTLVDELQRSLRNTPEPGAGSAGDGTTAPAGREDLPSGEGHPSTSCSSREGFQISSQMSR